MAENFSKERVWIGYDSTNQTPILTRNELLVSASDPEVDRNLDPKNEIENLI